jgi:hypothetical protein
MTNTIKVVALVADNQVLTFYQENGVPYTVTQGDPRGLAMADEYAAQRRLGKTVIELAIDEQDPTYNVLTSEKRSKLLRFFVVAKNKVKKLFGAEQHDPDFTEESHEAAIARVQALATKLMTQEPDAPSSEDDELPVRMVTAETKVEKHETIVAVSEHGITPHVENLSDQMVAAEEGKGSNEGIDNFLLRMTKISAKRGHTATELMNFIKRIDLGFLPDGSFLAYKRLIHIGNGVYVDPHSRKVHQRIGDIVTMDEKLVDPSKRTQCSQGIHVGTRRYMGGFHATDSASGTMLVLIQPEDVIAVPNGEADKMRVCKYLLLGDLSNKAHNLVNQNKAMDSCEATMDLLANILAGARPALLGTVRIGGEYGSKLTYTINGQDVKTDVPLTEARSIANGEATPATHPVTPVRTINTERQGNRADMTEQHKVRTKDAVVKPAAIKEAASAPPTREEVAKGYLKDALNSKLSDKTRREAALNLKAFKKTKKVGWDALGITAKDLKSVEEIITLTEPSKAAAKPAAPVAPKQPEPSKPQAPANESRQDKARRLWAMATDKNWSEPCKKGAAQELRDFKKTAKVSWTSLGLGNYDVEGTLKKLLG